MGGPLNGIAGGSPQENAETLRQVLSGKGGAIADFVVLNAAAGCFVAGLVDDFASAATLARESITSGRAHDVAETYITLSQEAL